jgi:ribonuclease P protein subunit RPR2
MRKGRKPAWQIKIAKERIQILFDLAKKEFKNHPERSKRYIQLLRKIGLRYNVRLPKEIKRSFCKNCNSLLIPGLSSEVRLNKRTKTVNIRCKNCNKIYRYPYR